MTLYIGAQGGVLQIVDVPHATDKDVRSLFALDSLKKQKRTDLRRHIHAPRIGSYYGDITGPSELSVIHQSLNEIAEYIEKIPAIPEAITSSSPSTLDMMSPSIAVSGSDPSIALERARSLESTKHKNPLAQCKSLFLRNGPLILHVSHYSFEWAVNVNDSIFTEDDTKEFNHYLVGSYQKTQYDRNLVNEFVTMGLTHNIPHREDQFRFFVDDFTEDLLRIQTQTDWIQHHHVALPFDVWMVVTQYAVDAILPVQIAVGAHSFSRCVCSSGFHDHQKEGHCEITVDDDKALHLMLTGLLKEKYRDSKGGLLTEWVKAIGRIFADWGKIVDAQYSPRRTQLKLEYNRWKKESYKKRPKLPAMHSLTERLRQHQLLKHDESMGAERDVPFLYFVNPNFQIRGLSRGKTYRSVSYRSRSSRERKDRSAKTPHHSTPRPKAKTSAKTSAIQKSIKKLFSFGQSSRSPSRNSSRKNSINAKSKISTDPSNPYGHNGGLCQLAQIVKNRSREASRVSTSRANEHNGSHITAPNTIAPNTIAPNTVAVSRTRKSIGPAPTRFAADRKPKGITKASTVPIASTTTTVSMMESGCIAEDEPTDSRYDQKGHNLLPYSSKPTPLIQILPLHGSAGNRYSAQSFSEDVDDWSPGTDIPPKRTSCPQSSRTLKYSKRLKSRYSHPRKDAQNRFITLQMAQQNSNQSGSESRGSMNSESWDYDSVQSNDPVDAVQRLKTRKLMPTMNKPRGRLSISSSCSDTPKSYYLRQEYLLSIRQMKVNNTPRVEEEPDEEEQHDFGVDGVDGNEVGVDDVLKNLRLNVTADEVEQALEAGFNEVELEVIRQLDAGTEGEEKDRVDEDFNLDSITLDVTFSDRSENGNFREEAAD